MNPLINALIPKLYSDLEWERGLALRSLYTLIELGIINDKRTIELINNIKNLHNAFIHNLGAGIYIYRRLSAENDIIIGATEDWIIDFNYLESETMIDLVAFIEIEDMKTAKDWLQWLDRIMENFRTQKYHYKINDNKLREFLNGVKNELKSQRLRAEITMSHRYEMEATEFGKKMDGILSMINLNQPISSNPMPNLQGGFMGINGNSFPMPGSGFPGYPNGNTYPTNPQAYHYNPTFPNATPNPQPFMAQPSMQMTNPMGISMNMQMGSGTNHPNMNQMNGTGKPQNDDNFVNKALSKLWKAVKNV